MVLSRSTKLSSLNKNIRDVIAPSETLTFGYLIIQMSRCFWFPDKAYLVFVGVHWSGLLVKCSFYVGFRQWCSVLASNILLANEKSERMIKLCFVCGRQKISSVFFDFAQKQGSSYSQRYYIELPFRSNNISTNSNSLTHPIFCQTDLTIRNLLSPSIHGTHPQLPSPANNQYVCHSIEHILFETIGFTYCRNLLKCHKCLCSSYPT